MGKGTKKIKKKDENQKKVFWMSMLLLVIMVMSVLGFALTMTGGAPSSDNGLPSEIPFQEFQDPNSGQVFWGAVRGGEQFIFLTLEGFSNQSDLAELAYNLKEYESINTYTTAGFNQSSSEFLIKKALRGLRIDTNNVYELDCREPTLVFGTEVVNENCMYFLADGNNTYFRAEALTYFLVQE